MTSGGMGNPLLCKRFKAILANVPRLHELRDMNLLSILIPVIALFC
ncbi:hypothetical protein SLEP1_g55623 [Rubroshorea leprosula]|uniref:Uncharacterized protein n=1 Tax=Rubroshorea leprosula TaxID=152421 RepID=A0AAV5MJS3_9ROSI|nr:hypothetical protein SLEP1_g55623 [Rubroshorea leprosula]